MLPRIEVNKVTIKEQLMADYKEAMKAKTILLKTLLVSLELQSSSTKWTIEKNLAMRASLPF
jgi:hypothetical protein